MGAFTENLDNLGGEVDELLKFSMLKDVDEASSKVFAIKGKLERCFAQVEIFNKHEKLFGWQET